MSWNDMKHDKIIRHNTTYDEMWCVYLTSRELSCAMLCSFTGSFWGLNFHMFSGSTGVGGELLRLPPHGGGLQEGWWGEQWPCMCACPGSRTQSMSFLRHWDVFVFVFAFVFVFVLLLLLLLLLLLSLPVFLSKLLWILNNGKHRSPLGKASRDDFRGSSEFECRSFGQVWAGPQGETLSWTNKKAWRIQDSEGEDGGRQC